MAPDKPLALCRHRVISGLKGGLASEETVDEKVLAGTSLGWSSQNQKRTMAQTAAPSHHFLFPDRPVAAAWEALGILS